MGIVVAVLFSIVVFDGTVPRTNSSSSSTPCPFAVLIVVHVAPCGSVLFVVLRSVGVVVFPAQTVGIVTVLFVRRTVAVVVDMVVTVRPVAAASIRSGMVRRIRCGVVVGALTGPFLGRACDGPTTKRPCAWCEGSV